MAISAEVEGHRRMEPAEVVLCVPLPYVGPVLDLRNRRA